MAADYELISKQTIESSTTTCLFHNIADTYEHLELFVHVKLASTSARWAALVITLNNDNSAKYNDQWTSTIFTNQSATYDMDNTYITTGGVATSHSDVPTDTFSAMKVTLPFYKRTNRVKKIFVSSGLAGISGDGYNLTWESGHNYLWHSGTATVAINRVQFTTLDGSNLVQGSTFALYGMKG